MENQGPYTQSLPSDPVDPERDWARGQSLGMDDPNRAFDRQQVGGYIGNRGRSMRAARDYASGYRLDDTPSNTVNSRASGRSRFANMTISEPAQVLDVTKPMG
jgi:hypothetical protein